MLGRQYQQQQRAWLEEMKQQTYTPVMDVTFEGFTTTKRLTTAEAEQGAFVPCPEGTPWGACWEYGWFRADFCLPEACAGRRVVLLGGLGGEQLYYCNGQAIGSVDKGHPYVTLTRCAKAGETVHLLVESYAGHGARLENLGLCPPERAPIPPVPDKQCTVGKCILAVWEEEAYQLLVDVYTLGQLMKVLPEKSLRMQRVAAAMDRFTHLADPELPMPERRESFRQARLALQEVLDCHNGSTAPLMWLLGQSHIDLAWLWPMEDTFRKAVRTYANQMTLLDEYPAYRYLLCEPALLDMLKSQDASLYQRVKDGCARGQILPEGAFFVECDTNLPSGESLIRQLQWGKKWFREEADTDPQVGWLPDCFGFTAALPQILKEMGVPYFATQKLQRADPECEGFPYHHFIWEGIDGSEVLGLSFLKDNGPIDPVSFKERWEDNRVQETNIDTLLHPFGYGDGGGGPTRDMVEISLRLKDLEGIPRSRYGGLREYFEHIAAEGVTNRWVGEMYLSWHRGVFTSQRRAKALMRRAEFALHDAEAMMARAPAWCTPADHAALHEAWRTLLLNQFHDVAGGVGIRRVHEESEQQLHQVIGTANELTEKLRQGFYDMHPAEGAWTVWNPLPWERTEWVQMDGRWQYLHAPADGAAQVTPMPQPEDARLTQTAEGYVLENRYLHVEVNTQGVITALADLENGLLLMAHGQRMNDWRLFQNVQAVYDAWELDRDWETRLMPDAMDVTVEVAEDTPGCCALRITRNFGNSRAVQVMRLYASSRRIDFTTHIDWQERHRMLKTFFESNILTDNAVHEIQFGYVTRPAHQSTKFASDRYEVCNHRYSALCEDRRGFALLNDGSYGISSQRGTLALTLLRAPLVPDDKNNLGEHDLTYALYPFATSLADSGVVQQGYALNQPLTVMRGSCRQPSEGFYADGLHVLVETIKPAEDGRGVVLRLYNSQHMYAKTTLHLPYAATVTECGMAEEEQLPIGKGNALELTFAPFRVRTFRVIKEA